MVPPAPPDSDTGSDCVVVIYTPDTAMLGKRFPLEHNPTTVGRGADNHIELDGDSISRKHARFERREHSWYIVDNGSTNGTYLNEDQIIQDAALSNGDRIKVGPTILKFLSGMDAEAKYHEEIYRMTIVDGLTQVHNKRYLLESLEREVVRARRHARALSVLMFDLDFFKNVNDQFGHLAGDHVLRELALLVQDRIRRDEVFARYGGEEFCILLPETAIEGAARLGEILRDRIAEHRFVFQGEHIPVTISGGCAQLEDNMSASELIQAADKKLYDAKQSGRNRICS